jgi:hypothetical protein
MSTKINIGYAATVLLASAALLLANAAQAMEIIKFDQMAAEDRQDFIDLLPNAAEKVLEQEGRRVDAAKVHHLFNDTIPGDALPIGVAELEGNLANARVSDAERHLQHPDAPRIQVETALAVTLSKNGIKITPDFVKSFMQLTGKFKPKHPPIDKKN